MNCAIVRDGRFALLACALVLLFAWAAPTLAGQQELGDEGAQPPQGTYRPYVPGDEGRASGNDQGNAFGIDQGNAFGNEEGNAFGIDQGNAFGNDEGNALGNDEGNAYGDSQGNGFGSSDGNAFPGGSSDGERDGD